MPGFCEPWPGNVKAVVMLSRLRGVAAPRYDQRSSPEVSVVSRLDEYRPRSAAQSRFTLRDPAAAEDEQRGNEPAENERSSQTARAPRTLHVTRHDPRLRSSLRPGIPTGRGSGLKTRTVRVRIPPGALVESDSPAAWMGEVLVRVLHGVGMILLQQRELVAAAIVEDEAWSVGYAHAHGGLEPAGRLQPL